MISKLVGVKLRTKTKRDSDATDCSDSVNLWPDEKSAKSKKCNAKNVTVPKMRSEIDLKHKH